MGEAMSAPPRATRYAPMLFGLAAALIFSSTFVVNRVLALHGDNWATIAFLRYIMQSLILALTLSIANRQFFLASLQSFRAHMPSWVLAGTLSYALMFAAVAYASNTLNSWLIATTLQLATIATPIVVRIFGLPTQNRSLVFSCVVVIGVFLVNQQYAGLMPAHHANLAAVLALVVAALAFPIGNQIAYSRLSDTASAQNRLIQGFGNTFLMTIGALPILGIFWVGNDHILPSIHALLGTMVITILGGLLATPLFQYARSLCKTGYELSAVDSTLASECLITPALEAYSIGLQRLTPTAWFGVALVCLGITSYHIGRPKK